MSLTIKAYYDSMNDTYKFTMSAHSKTIDFYANVEIVDQHKSEIMHKMYLAVEKLHNGIMPCAYCLIELHLFNTEWTQVGFKYSVPSSFSSKVKQESNSFKTMINELTKVYPVLGQETIQVCPASSSCFPPENYMRMIIHLNDVHEWTREAVADWFDNLTKLGVIDINRAELTKETV